MPRIIGTGQIIEVVEGTPTTIYKDGYATGYEQMQFENFLKRNGYEQSTDAYGSSGIFEYKGTTQTGGVNTSADVPVKITEVLDPSTQQPTGDLQIDPLRPNTVKTTVPAQQLLMPALTGAGLGWESYKEYPKFWSDLSNALFSTDFITTGQLSDKSAVDVLIETFEDGGIKAYCEEQHVRSVLERAYALGAFNSHGQYTPQYSDEGTYVLTGGGMCTANDIYNLLGKPTPVNTEDAEGFIANNIQYVENYKGQTADSVLWRVTTSSDGLPSYEGFLFHIGLYSSYELTISESGNPQIEENKSRSACLGYITFTLSRYGAEDTWLSSSNNVGIITRDIARNGWLTTVGAEYNAPLPHLKHNDALPTVTSDDDVFSNLADWIAQGFTVESFNPSTGEMEEKTYLPIGMYDTDANPSQDPTAEGQEDAQSGDISQPQPFELPSWLSDFFLPSIVLPSIGIPSELPTGDTPVVVPPTNNNSSKLFTVYNPNATQLDSLGGYLWSDSIATLIKELFANNRMDAIISLHQVYVTPSTTTAHNIILGNLDSGVSAPVVNNQYVEVDCGTQFVAEMYGDARDYLNVDCQVYLPFIGFRNVDPHDIINCYLNIKYTIDVYTGSCLAQLIVTKGGYTQTLYTFEGNCSVQIPLTGSDRARIIGAIASTVATGIATGGVGAVGMAVGQVASGGAQSSIQRTSGFSGNCGAMAIKKPYIVLTRLKSADATNYNTIVGNPTNKTVYLCNMKGFTRVKEIHLDNLSCTDTEKRIIYDALKQGVVL